MSGALPESASVFTKLSPLLINPFIHIFTEPLHYFLTPTISWNFPEQEVRVGTVICEGFQEEMRPEVSIRGAPASGDERGQQAKGWGSLAASRERGQHMWRLEMGLGQL